MKFVRNKIFHHTEIYIYRVVFFKILICALEVLDLNTSDPLLHVTRYKPHFKRIDRYRNAYAQRFKVVTFSEA